MSGNATGTNGVWCDEHARTDCGCIASAPSEVVVRLDAVEPERVSWLWPGRIPLGKMTVLDGDPGVGKSTLSLDLAARVSTGTPWPDQQACPRGAVVLLSAEDGLADTIRPRLDAAGADPTRVHALTAITVTSTDSDGLPTVHTRPPHLGDLDRIEKVIVSTGAVLLVVDVLMAYMPAGVDSHRDQDVRGVLHRLAATAERTGCAVLLLRHLNKSSGGPALYRGGGSIGIVGAARAGFVAARDPDDEQLVVLAPTKNNLSAPPDALGYRLVTTEHGAARVEWTGTVDRKAGDLLRHRDDLDGDDRREIERWLEEYLTDAGGSAPAGEVITAGRTLFTEQAIKKARMKIATSSRAGFGKGAVYTWSLHGFSIDSMDSTSREPESMEPMRESMALDEPDPPEQNIPLHACAGEHCQVPGCSEGGAA